jgi:pimeloyl-ACP methyl ester carboxylesterase
MNPKIYSSIAIFCFSLLAFASATQRSFNLYDEVFREHKLSYIDGDTISFLLVESAYDFEKPTVFYLPGSLPKPLIYEFEDGYQMIVPFQYFDTKALFKNYNVILVGKPFTPIHARETDLVNGLSVPDTSNPNCFDLKYLRCDNLDYLGKRIDFLINSLLEKKMLNDKRIIVMGHSQGGREAPRIAALNRNVTDVVILSASPYGRIQHILTDLFRDVLVGKRTLEDFQEYRTMMLEDFKSAFEKSDSLHCDRATSENLLGFASHTLDDLVQTRANVFYAAGTHDIPALYADQLLIDCWMRNKFNIVMKLYPNSEHSFIHVNPDGSLDYEIMYWNLVIQDVLKWLKKE